MGYMYICRWRGWEYTWVREEITRRRMNSHKERMMWWRTESNEGKRKWSRATRLSHEIDGSKHTAEHWNGGPGMQWSWVKTCAASEDDYCWMEARRSDGNGGFRGTSLSRRLTRGERAVSSPYKRHASCDLWNRWVLRKTASDVWAVRDETTGFRTQQSTTGSTTVNSAPLR